MLFLGISHGGGARCRGQRWARPWGRMMTGVQRSGNLAEVVIGERQRPHGPWPMSYAALRQRVLAKLSPEAEVSDHERALYGLAHLAVSGDAEGAALDQVVSEREWPLVEHATAELEARFADEIAARRRRLAADPGPPDEQAAVLWRAFISAPLP
jgi:hypothetical protein